MCTSSILRKIGSSYVVTIHEDLFSELGIEVGDTPYITKHAEDILLTPYDPEQE